MCQTVERLSLGLVYAADPLFVHLNRTEVHLRFFGEFVLGQSADGADPLQPRLSGSLLVSPVHFDDEMGDVHLVVGVVHLDYLGQRHTRQDVPEGSGTVPLVLGQGSSCPVLLAEVVRREVRFGGFPVGNHAGHHPDDEFDTGHTCNDPWGSGTEKVRERR